MTEITKLLNPRNFKVTVHKVRPMYRPKFYLAGMQIKNRVRLLRSNTRHKTHGAALDYSNKVMKRWCRLYDSALMALSTPLPALPHPSTAASTPSLRTNMESVGSSPIPAEA